MVSALRIEPLSPSITTDRMVKANQQAAVCVVGRYQLTEVEVEILEFRCQALNAQIDLDVMRMEELMRD